MATVEEPNTSGTPGERPRAFTIFPSIHLRDGRVVHLVKGEPGPEPISDDPLAVARSFRRDGAEWLHVLSMSTSGHPCDLEAIAALVEKSGLKVQLAGSHAVVDDTSLARALATGVHRLNLSTAALEDRRWCAKVISLHGDRIGVTLPVWISPDGPRLAYRGRLQDGGDLWSLIEDFNRIGCTRYAVTDVGREGTMTGPNLQLLKEVAQRTDALILAAGGIATLDDVRAVARLAPHGVGGALIGRALFAGAFTVREAVSVGVAS
ncbi:HisA/HisF-related TIM barrel protein [Streptomyces sp. URMC 126]|uniref:HisA/HisF-related TIM barrel protein n=1 Tax=Streptomyces sp. URMC 126 TaxID=3423401 RepID=UPI003F1DD53F